MSPPGRRPPARRRRPRLPARYRRRRCRRHDRRSTVDLRPSPRSPSVEPARLAPPARPGPAPPVPAGRRSRPRPCTCCARWPASSSGRRCCSRAARTRSCCCAWPSRRSGPGPFPFPIVHVDTGHNFPEALEFRDRRVAELGERLVVASVQDSIDRGRVADPGPTASRNRLQTTTLLDAIEAHALRLLHRRRPSGRGQGPGQGAGVLVPRRLRAVGAPRTSGPSCGSSTTAASTPASTCGPSPSRTGPSSTCGATSPPRASRCPPSTSPTAARSSSATGCCGPSGPWTPPRPGESRADETVRYRTVGDMTCTGAVRSDAATVEAGHRRGGRGPHHRAGRHPGRRPLLRRGHGGPQARGLLLMASPTRRPGRSMAELLRFATAGSVDDGK